jgi:hypothetical protein
VLVALAYLTPDGDRKREKTKVVGETIAPFQFCPYEISHELPRDSSMILSSGIHENEIVFIFRSVDRL